MDELARRLWQKLVAYGQVEDFLFQALEEVNDDLAIRLFRFARFQYERRQKLYGRGDKRVAIKYLSDAAIIRRISEPNLKRIRREIANGYRRDKERGLWDLILEEAEYRGLKTEEQLHWENLRDMSPAARSKHIGRKLTRGECIERGGCKYMYDASSRDHICTSCRRRISDEEVMARINRECLGSGLRLSTLRLRGR